MDIEKYRDGGEGMIAWCNENVCMPIFQPGARIATWVPFSDLPTDENEVGNSYKSLWDNQGEVLREALEMKNGEFIHTLICLVWMRGEGKSILACLIQAWKFFCFPRQRIILAANSKDQVVFAHYDILVEIIHNSPNLLVQVGKDNIQLKEIRIKDDNDNIVSYIRTVSSFSGLKPNLTGYTFSEMFEMKSPRFFSQIDGSTRNTPNALGVIDSTVSSKQHQLYKLYQTYINGKDPSLYFSFRSSKPAKVKDFWHPKMTQEQLNAKKERFMLGEFEKYFENSWSAGAERVFSEENIEATQILGVDNQIMVHEKVIEILEAKNKLIEQEKKILQREGTDDEIEETKTKAIAPILKREHADRFKDFEQRFWRVKDLYTLSGSYGEPSMASGDDLNQIGELYDTNWAILTGMDRADPMKTKTAARTIVTAVAKGLAGSRTNPYPTDEKAAPRYLYFLLHLQNIHDHSIEVVKDVLKAVRDEYDGIDSFGTERWGAVDMVQWCEDENIATSIYYPTYSRQRSIFTELAIAYYNGRFKTPPLVVRGSKMDDILVEEASVFDHNPESSKSKFGSPEKMEKYGVQDDAMFSLGSAVYGGLNLGVDSFRERKGRTVLSMFLQSDGLMGSY